MSQIWRWFGLGLSDVGGAIANRLIPVHRSRYLTKPQGLVGLFCTGLILSLNLVGCAPTPAPESSGSSPTAAQKPPVEITLVSFAVTKEAHDRIIPKFTQQWQQQHGQAVTFNRSYGGSGSQTRAVIDGLEADIVHLALALDTQKIESAGLIQPGWEKELPNDSIVSKSVPVIVTREGNPKGIKTWSDLGKDGVKVITADPKTSGVARWNFMALWNAAIAEGGDDSKAQTFVTSVYKNVPILPKDAREATDVFLKGQGDALINYENELILAAQKGKKAEYLVPEINLSIDNPIAIVDKNVDKHGNREVVEAFAQYLFTPEAQQEFAAVGFRPVDATIAQKPEFVSQFPAIKTLKTIQDYGGWADVQKKFFADNALFDQIQKSLKG